MTHIKQKAASRNICRLDFYQNFSYTRYKRNEVRILLLSLDLSTKSTGYAIWDKDKLIDYGLITASSQDLIKRIQKITNDLNDILKAKSANCSIDKVIVEEVRPENGLQNIQTHRALMWLQGAIATMFHDDYNLSLEYVYPSEWRSKCGIKTGAGIKRESLKKKDIAFVKETFNIDVNDDIADAIGIGYAYNQTALKEINWK